MADSLSAFRGYIPDVKRRLEELIIAQRVLMGQLVIGALLLILGSIKAAFAGDNDSFSRVSKYRIRSAPKGAPRTNLIALCPSAR